MNEEMIIQANREIGEWMKKKECIIYTYDVNWSALIPVWLKIMEWGINEHGVQWQQEITESMVVISNNKNGDLRICVWCGKGTFDISSLFTAVHQFVTWYKKQQP